MRGLVVLVGVVVDQHAGSRAAASPARGSLARTAAAPRSKPMLRAATAGNSASRSSVSVKMQLTTSLGRELVALEHLAHQLLVAPRIASASLASTVVAPRRANSRIGGGSCQRRERAQALDLRRAQPPCAPSAQRAQLAAGRSARAAASSTGGRPPRTCAGPGACGPRGSSARSRRRRADAPARARSGRPRARRPRAAAPARVLADRRAADLRAVGLRAPRSAGASAGWRARRRWSAGSARCVSASRRPTGYRRTPRVADQLDARSGARACRCAVETTPAGLLHRVARAARPRRARRAVDRAPASCSPHVARRVGDDLAVDAHAPGGDQRLGGAPRGDAGVGEELGEAHRRCTCTIGGAMDLDLLADRRSTTLAGEPRFRARQVWALGRARRRAATTR